MRVVSEADFAKAVEFLIVTAANARDESGLRIRWMIESEKAQSLILGALVASCESPDTVKVDHLQEGFSYRDFLAQLGKPKADETDEQNKEASNELGTDGS